MKINNTYVKYSDELKNVLLSDEISRIIVYGDNGEKVEYHRENSVQSETAKDINVLNNDTINRQAAIDAIKNNVYAITPTQIDTKIDCIESVEAVPSAQPEQPEIVRCKDCKHWEYDVIFADGWCRGKQQGNPEWFCADAERKNNV